jgi:hypothetical protein
MHFSPEKVETRREFVRTASRYGLLTLVAAVAAVAARGWTAAGQRCVNRGICSGCDVFASCGLPQALSAKSARRGG